MEEADINASLLLFYTAGKSDPEAARYDSYARMIPEMRREHKGDFEAFSCSRVTCLLS